MGATSGKSISIVIRYTMFIASVFIHQQGRQNRMELRVRNSDFGPSYFGGKEEWKIKFTGGQSSRSGTWRSEL
jgi:hypothetical protein